MGQGGMFESCVRAAEAAAAASGNLGSKDSEKTSSKSKTPSANDQQQTKFAGRSGAEPSGVLDLQDMGLWF